MLGLSCMLGVLMVTVLVRGTSWCKHVGLVTWHTYAWWLTLSVTVVGEMSWCKQAGLAMLCVHLYLTKEVSTSVKLEVSQFANCGWRGIMVQVNWACDVRHVYHWLWRRETPLLGSGQKFKKLAGWCSVNVLYIQESFFWPGASVIQYWYIDGSLLSVCN